MTIDEMKTFVEKVIEMRNVQKEFFRTRNYASMQLSKQLEKDIDDSARKLLAKFRAEQVQNAAAAQFDLFSD